MERLILKTQIKNIVSFSGGKDSTALILWAKENLNKFDTIFCDTGWENEITYDYIKYINKTLLGGKLITLKSSKYNGFADMSIKRSRVPSSMARFCTVELKLNPTVEYIHNNLKEFQVHLFNGIRAGESLSRSKMEIVEFDGDYFGTWIHRPLLKWSVQDVFEIHKKYNIEPNPLYKMGLSRVGCFPCIMARLSEIKIIAKKFPEHIQKIRDLENKLGRTYFPANKIPVRFRGDYDPKSGVKIAFIDDVVNYVKTDPNQEELFEPVSCMSKYNICE